MKHQNKRIDRSFLVIATCLVLSMSFHLSVMGAEAFDSREITQAIETELLLDNMVDSYNIDISVNEGIATLSGNVNNILSKERAVRIAESVKGVRSVVNKLNVMPLLGKPPERIQKNIEDALIRDPATDTFEIDVSVREPGYVILKGEVESWTEKRLVEKIAKSISGVTGIKNDIHIDYPEHPSDYKTKQEIKKRLEYDIWVDANLIKVKVKNMHVTLSGIVGSLLEKRYAQTDAWIYGVNSVDATNLDAKWWAKNNLQKEEQYPEIIDDDIKKAVQDAFTYDPRVYSFNPTINVENGVVTLTGTVNNLMARKAAEKDAKNTMGVWRVKNFLKVRPDVLVADELIESRIKSTLATDPIVDLYNIDVMVINGKVRLNGRVNYRAERQRAENIVSRQPGVINVNNKIIVDDPWIFKTDREIKEDIEYELFWSLRVNKKINVDVEQGIATLNGTVDTPYEAEAAIENAFKGGARSVINYLKVKRGRSNEGIYNLWNYNLDFPYYYY